MVDPFPFQLREGTGLPAEWLSSPCLGADDTGCVDWPKVGSGQP